MAGNTQAPYRRGWRDYTTSAGNKPVEDTLSDDDAAAVADGMDDVAQRGTVAARHLQNDIWEVRVDGDHQTFRVLFAPEGRSGQILLALVGFSKKTQKTPPQTIKLAETRLKDWRARGVATRKAKAAKNTT